MQEMPEDPQKIEEIIRHYLETGEDTSLSELAYKPPFPRPTKEELLTVLSKEVKKKERERPAAIIPPEVDPSILARSKAARMARGFFPATERDPVHRLLERSVVFLTADTIHQLIASSRWLRTAWRIANMYLDSIGANLFGKGRKISTGRIGRGNNVLCFPEIFQRKRPFC